MAKDVQNVLRSMLRNMLRNKEAIRRYARVAAFAVLGISVGVLVASQYQVLEYQNQIVEYLSVGERDPEVLTPYSLPASEPVSLSIPKLNINTTFEEPLGLNEDRTIEVPDSYDKVGWYKYGPTPGELGPAVILGHVDSYQGPAVFFYLGQLAVGDEIDITRSDGTIAKFSVTALERYEQSVFPRELVYGDIDYAGLRLVTCSGTYVHGAQRYTHNLVVYAALDESENNATSTTEE